jgi:hypothetical protein
LPGASIPETSASRRFGRVLNHIGLVRQPILLNPTGFELSNKSRKMLCILLFYKEFVQYLRLSNNSIGFVNENHYKEGKSLRIFSFAGFGVDLLKKTYYYSNMNLSLFQNLT